MKKKQCIGQTPFLQEAFLAGSWPQLNPRKANRLRRFIKRYQKTVDTILAITAIGLMCLTGVWLFLVQLAECGLK